jgi:hypothetical protein
VPLVTYAQDYMLSEWTANHALYGSLHTGYSASGANELSGGSPAYARLALTWSSAAGGAQVLSGTYTFNVPASTTVEYIGFWDALTGGNFQGMFPNAAGANAYAFAAPSSSGILLAPGSAYTANQTVVVFASPGSSLPSGLTGGTVYYVKSPASDSFNLATTSGGSAITLSSDGSGIVQYVAVEAFISQGTLQVTAGSVSVT